MQYYVQWQPQHQSNLKQCWNLTGAPKGNPSHPSSPLLMNEELLDTNVFI